MDDFNFYIRLAKPLALNMPDAKDRTMAARWLKKLCQVDQSDVGPSDNIHVEYLKLLLFAMQGNRLSGIFEKPPPAGDLQEILQSPTERRKKAKDMIALTKGHRIPVSEGAKLISKRNPPVRRSIGGDMCEYVAVQEIPNFGIHGYYVLSTEPLSSWWNPPSSATASDLKPCFKYTCENAAAGPITEGIRDSDETFEAAIEEIRPKPENNSGKKPERINAALSVNDRSSFSCEAMGHGEKSLKKIFENQRNEIAGVETRPCWGRSRYIDRLIDESPHLVGDLDLSEADALLNVYRGKKLRKVKKSGKEGSETDPACAISSRRKQVEERLDMPPCAPIVIEDEDFNKGQQDARLKAVQKSRVCFPRKNDLGRLTDLQDARQGCCTETEDEDSYSTDPSIASSVSISLRGGAYETLWRDCWGHLQNNTIDMLETNDDGNWQESLED